MDLLEEQFGPVLTYAAACNAYDYAYLRFHVGCANRPAHPPRDSDVHDAPKILKEERKPQADSVVKARRRITVKMDAIVMAYWFLRKVESEEDPSSYLRRRDQAL